MSVCENWTVFLLHSTYSAQIQELGSSLGLHAAAFLLDLFTNSSTCLNFAGECSLQDGNISMKPGVVQDLDRIQSSNSKSQR